MYYYNYYIVSFACLFTNIWNHLKQLHNLTYGGGAGGCDRERERGFEERVLEAKIISNSKLVCS